MEGASPAFATWPPPPSQKAKNQCHFFQMPHISPPPPAMPLPGLPGVSDSSLFGGLNLCLIGWALLACPPFLRPTYWETVIVTLCAIFGVLYVLTLTNAVVSGSIPETAGFSSLEGVVELFKVPKAVFSGWVHYVCHDLLVGLWLAKDSEARGIPHLLFASVVLPIALLAGPAGVVIHLFISLAWPKASTKSKRN
jgi:hypothetical protein